MSTYLNSKLISRYSRVYVSIVLVCGLWGSAVTFAYESDLVQGSETVIAESRITVEQAAESLAEKIEGQILEGKTIRDGEKEYYEFKVLSPEDGRVSFITVDPETGEIQDL